MSEEARAEASRGASELLSHPRDVLISRWLLVLIPTLLAALVFGSRAIVTSPRMTLRAARMVANGIAAKTDSAVRLRGLSFGWAYQPCIQELQIYRAGQSLQLTLATEEACAERWASAVGSGFRALQVHLTRPSIELKGLGEGSSPSPLVDVRPATATVAGGRRPESRRQPLREIGLRFDDLRLAWKNLPLPARLATGGFGPIDGALTLQRRGSASAVTIDLREPRTGLVIAGRATPTPEGWDLSAQVEGDLAPTFGRLMALPGVDVQRLPVKGEIGIIYSAQQRRLAMDLDLVERDADIANALVSSRRLAGFEARQRLRVLVDGSGFRIEDGAIEINSIPVQISLDVNDRDGSPELRLVLALRTVSFARLFLAIPGSEPIPALASMSPLVSIALSFKMEGLLRDPETWKISLEHRVIGVGADGAGSGLEYLRGSSWEHRPLTRAGRVDPPRPMGSSAPGWVRYGALPYPLKSAIQVSEDAGYFLHQGVDVEEIRAAIVEKVSRGERTRGGSTLTQQLVKNLYLTRERTATRKLQELLLSFLLESALTKDQIFEIYANLIEWGPGVYGISQASQHYFGCSPQQLSIKQAAYLAAIIPGPTLYHTHYEQGAVPPKFKAKVSKLLERLAHLGRISEEELAAANEEPIRFFKKSRPAPSP